MINVFDVHNIFNICQPKNVKTRSFYSRRLIVFIFIFMFMTYLKNFECGMR